MMKRFAALILSLVMVLSVFAEPVSAISAMIGASRALPISGEEIATLPSGIPKDSEPMHFIIRYWHTSPDALSSKNYLPRGAEIVEEKHTIENDDGTTETIITKSLVIEGYIYVEDGDHYYVDKNGVDLQKGFNPYYTLIDNPTENQHGIVFYAYEAYDENNELAESFSGFSVSAGRTAFKLNDKDNTLTLEYDPKVHLAKSHVFYIDESIYVDGTKDDAVVGSSALGEDDAEDNVYIYAKDVDVATGKVVGNLVRNEANEVLRKGDENQFAALGIKRSEVKLTKVYSTTDGLHTDKTASVNTKYNDGRTFDLDLEAWFIGNNIADVGMVLDASGSMAFASKGARKIQLSDAQIAVLEAKEIYTLTQDNIDKSLVDIPHESLVAYYDFIKNDGSSPDDVNCPSPKHNEVGHGTTGKETGNVSHRTWALNRVDLNTFAKRVKQSGSGKISFVIEYNVEPASPNGDASRWGAADNTFNFSETNGFNLSYSTNTQPLAEQPMSGLLVASESLWENNLNFTVSFSLNKVAGRFTGSESNLKVDEILYIGGMNPAAGENYFRLYRDGGSNSNYIKADISSSGNADIFSRGSNNGIDGKGKRYYTLVFSETEDNKTNVKVYVNGKLVNGNGVDIENLSGNRIIFNGLADDYNGTDLWADDITVFDTALKKSEVGTLYSAYQSKGMSPLAEADLADLKVNESVLKNNFFLDNETLNTILDPRNTDNSLLGYSGYSYFVYSEGSTALEQTPIGYWSGKKISEKTSAGDKAIALDDDDNVIGILQAEKKDFDSDGLSSGDYAGWYYISSGSIWEDITGDTVGTSKTIVPVYGGRDYPYKDSIVANEAVKKALQISRNSGLLNADVTYTPTSNEPIQFFVDADGYLCCFTSAANSASDDKPASGLRQWSFVYELDDKDYIKQEVLQRALGSFVTKLSQASPRSKVSAVQFSTQNVPKDADDTLVLLDWTDEPSKSATVLNNSKGKGIGGNDGEYNYIFAGGTYTARGLNAFIEKLAKSEKIKDDKDARKYLILFTDGVDNTLSNFSGSIGDGSGGISDQFYTYIQTRTTAKLGDGATKSAWALAKDLKDNYGYTIFAVMLTGGTVMEGTDEFNKAKFYITTLAGSKEWEEEHGYEKSPGQRDDRYTPEKAKEFFFHANDVNQLTKLFTEDILSRIADSLTSYTVQDYIDPRFNLVDDDVRVWELNAEGNVVITYGDVVIGKYTLADFNTDETTAEDVVPVPDGFEIGDKLGGSVLYLPITLSTASDVDEKAQEARLYFDEEANMYFIRWIKQTIPGSSAGSSKLPVWNGKITVQAKDDFIGGNAVMSNGNAGEQNFVYSEHVDPDTGTAATKDSGVSNANPANGSKGYPSKGFPRTTVNVAVPDLEMDGGEQVIYMGETLTSSSVAQKLGDTINDFWEQNKDNPNQWYWNYLSRYAVHAGYYIDANGDVKTDPDSSDFVPEKAFDALLLEIIKAGEAEVGADKSVTYPYYYISDVSEDGEPITTQTGSSEHHEGDVFGHLVFQWTTIVDDAEEYPEAPGTTTDTLRRKSQLEITYVPLEEGDKDTTSNDPDNPANRTEANGNLTTDGSYAWNSDVKHAAGDSQEAGQEGLNSKATYATDIVKGEIVLEMLLDKSDIEYLIDHGYGNQTITYSAKLKRTYGDKSDADAGVFTAIYNIPASKDDIITLEGDDEHVRMFATIVYETGNDKDKEIDGDIPEGLPVGDYKLVPNDEKISAPIGFRFDDITILDLSKADSEELSKYQTYNYFHVDSGNEEYDEKDGKYYHHYDNALKDYAAPTTESEIRLGTTPYTDASDRRNTDDRYGLARITGKMDLGEVTIKKTVTNNNAHEDFEQFKFTVKLLESDGTTPLKGTFGIRGTVQKDANGDTIDTIKNGDVIVLRTGEHITVTDLPVGAKVIVTENKTDLRFNYNTTITVENGSGTAVTGSDPGTTVTVIDDVEEVDGDEVTVTFDNELKLGNLTLQKNVVNAPASAGDDEFTIIIELTDKRDVDSEPLTGIYKYYLYSNNTRTEKDLSRHYDDEGKVVSGQYELKLKAGERAEIIGLPDGAKYTIVEDTSEDGFAYDATYTSTNTADVKQVSSDTSWSETVTNEYKTGALKLSKSVTGVGADTTKAFTFTIKLEAPDGVTLDTEYAAEGDAPEITAGKLRLNSDDTVTVTLKDGQSITVKDLPEGTKFTVTEAEDGKYGYTTTATITTTIGGEQQVENVAADATSKKIIAEGEIVYDVKSDPHAPATVSVVYTNEFKTGKLEVSKIVFGPDGENDDELYNDEYFTFTFTFEDEDGNELTGRYKYSIDGNDSDTTVASGESIQLKHNQTVTIEGLPNGTKYTVTEAVYADYDSVYTGSKNSGVIGAEGDSGKVEAVNTRRSGEVSISKQLIDELGRELTDYDKAQEFTFTVSIPGVSGADITGVMYTTDGDETPKELTKVDGKYTITLKHDETVTIINLPVGATVTFIEDTDSISGGYEFYSIASGNIKVVKDESAKSAKVTIDAGDNGTVIYNNVKKTTKLDITKTVISANSVVNTNDTFEFTVTLTPPTGETLADTYKIEGVSGKTEIELEAVADSTENEKTFKVTLKHGQTATVIGLPYGTTYTVVEADKNNYALVDENNVEDYGNGAYTEGLSGSVGTADSDVVNYSLVPDIEIEKTVKGEDEREAENGGDLVVKVGEELTYTITVTAAGDAGAVSTDVKVTDRIPNGLELVESSIRPEDYEYTILGAGDTGYDPNFTTIVWTLGNMKSGDEDTGEITLTYKVKFLEPETDETVSYTNVAKVETGEGNTGEDDETVTNNPGQLVISKTVVDTFGNTLGDDTTKFEFTVKFIPHNGKTIAGSYPYTLSNDNNTHSLVLGAAEADGSRSGTITLEAGQTATIEGLPTGIEYTVVEVSVDTDGIDGNENYKLKSSENDSGNINDNTVYTAKFCNVYEPTETSVSIPVAKTVDGTLPVGDSYKFDFEAKLISATVNGVSVTEGLGTTSAASLTYPNDTEKTLIADTYTAAGEYVYIVSEKAGSDTDVITYDTNTYRVVVTVEETDGALSATYEIFDKDGELIGEGDSDDGDAVPFKNTYKPLSTTAHFEGVKNLTDNIVWSDNYSGKFSFTLEPVGNAPMPKDPSDVTGKTQVESETKPNVGHGITFSEIEFTEAKTYEYTITEAEYNADNITNDPIVVVNVKVVVIDDHGQLRATVTYDHGENKGESSFEFCNVYTPESVKTDAPVVTKILNNRDLAAGEFTFNYLLTKTAESDGSEPESAWSKTYTAHNDANGNVVLDDNGKLEFPSAGKYTLTITEDTVGLEEKHITSEGGPFTVEYEVTYDELTGKLSVKVTNEPGNIEFVNTFDGTVKRTPEVTKVYLGADGRTIDLEDGKFEFSIEITTEDGEFVYDSENYGTVKNAAGGTVTFGEITFVKPGTYTATISEVIPDEFDGILYDDTPITFVYVVEFNPENDTLDVNTEKSVIPTDPTITNKEIATASATPVVMKKYLDVDGKPIALKGGEFEFSIEITPKDGVSYNGDAVVANVSGGTVTFGEIEFTKPGTYTAIVTENPSAEFDGILYDGTEIKFVYVVELNEAGDELVITSTTATPSDPTFTNKKIDTVSAIPEVTKKYVDASGETIDLEGGEFDFSINITTADGEFIYDSENYGTVSNIAGGKVIFGEIIFKKPGTYTVTVEEKIPDLADSHIVYDRKTVTISYVVSDNGDGTLSVSDPVYVGNDGTFTNVYSKGSLKITKMVTGEGGDKNEQFTFTVKLTAPEDSVLASSYPVTPSAVDGVAAPEITELSLNYDAESGKYVGTVLLKHGQSITVNGLPEGTGYEVVEVEADQNGYSTKYTDEIGIITANGLPSATIVNSKNVRNLTVSKIVAGPNMTDSDYNRPFHFTIRLTAPESVALEASYPVIPSAIDGVAVPEITALTLVYDPVSGEYIGTAELKHGQSITIDSLPEGTGYTVTEDEANEFYTTVSTGDVGTLPESGDKYAVFVNTKGESSLTVTKVVVGDDVDLDDGFDFTITLTDPVTGNELEGAYAYIGFNGYTYPNGATSGTFTSGDTVTLKHLQSITILGLPAGTKYKVTEADYTLFGYETEFDHDEGIIPLNTGASAVFVNSRYKKHGDLTVSKTVVSDDDNRMIDEAAYFAFEIRLYEDATLANELNGDDDEFTVVYPNGSKGALKSGDTVMLRHNDSIVVKDIPAGTYYIVRELNVSIDDFNVIPANDQGTVPVDDSANAVFVNARVIKPTGGLMITKTVDSELPDYEKSFLFTVQLDTAVDAVLNIIASDGTTIGTYAFENGFAQFTLRHGDSAYVAGLPEGTQFTVTEADYSADGYTTMVGEGILSVGNMYGGVIPAKDIAVVSFINSTDDAPVGTGSLMITKSVVSDGSDHGKPFDFKLTLSDPTIGATIVTPYGNIPFIGSVNFTLTHGQSAYVRGIPEGIGYIVEENPDNDYTTTVHGAANGQIIAQAIASVNFVNTARTGNLTVTKTVAGDPNYNGGKFGITVKLTPALLGVYTYGDITFTDGIAYLELGDGESKTATGLPVGTAYEVFEENSGIYKPEFRGKGGVIIEDATAYALVINSLPAVETPDGGTLTIVKAVTGDDADITDVFEFVVTLTNADGEYNYVGAKQDRDTVKSGDTVKLKHGESITILGLPAGATYSVEELPNAYTAEPIGEEGMVAEDVPAVAVFVNSRFKDTGSLTVTKIVTGDGDTGKEFTFTIELSDKENTYNYFGDKNGTIKGELTIGLAHGESITIVGLPLGTTYTVEEVEANMDGYATTVVDGSGTITDAIAYSTVFVNDKHDTSDTPTTPPTPPTPKPNISITKTAVSGGNVGTKLVVKTGDTVTYSITVKNTGDAVAKNVIVTDEVPAGLAIDESSITLGGKLNGRTVTWTIGDLAVGATVTVSFNVTVPDEESSWGNIAKVEYNDPNDPDGKPEEKTSETATIESEKEGEDEPTPPTPPVTKPNISITKTAANSGNVGTKLVVKTGDTVTYSITVKNTGDAVAKNVIVTDEVPAGLAIDESSITLGGKLSGRTVTWTIGDLAVGATVTVSFNVTVPDEESSWGNIAKVEYNDPNDPDGKPEEKTSETATIESEKEEEGEPTPPTPPVTKPNISITKTAANGGNVGTKLVVKTGDTVTYSITVKNIGDGAATNVVVTDEVPEGLTIDESSITLGGKLSGRTVTWTIGDLAVGATVTVSFNVTVPDEESSWGNIAKVEYNDPNAPDGKPEEKTSETATIESEKEGEDEPTPPTPPTPSTPEYGSLTITKHVLTGEYHREFSFRVVLTDNRGNAVSGSFSYNGSKSGTIVSGNIITLKHGESVTIYGIPLGTHYVVTELTPTSYTVSSYGTTGEIVSADTVYLATFVNSIRSPGSGITPPPIGGTTPTPAPSEDDDDIPPIVEIPNATEGARFADVSESVSYNDGKPYLGFIGAAFAVAAALLSKKKKEH